MSHPSKQECHPPKRPHKSNTNTSSTSWIDNILLTARAVSTIAEAFPFAKGVCDTTIIVLDQIATIQSNEESLKELAEGILEVLNIISRELETHDGEVNPHFSETCNRFTQALADIAARLETYQERSNGCLVFLRRFMSARSLADQISGCRETIERHKGEFVLATTVGTRLEISGARQNLAEIHKTTRSTDETLTSISQKLTQGMELRQNELKKLEETIQHQEERSSGWDLQVSDHSRGHTIHQNGGSMTVTHGPKIRYRSSGSRRSTKSPIKGKGRKPF